MNRDECVEKIRKLIPDEKVRSAIFRGDEDDEDDFLCSKESILVYFSNILNIAFLYIFAHYRKWKEVDNVIDEKSPNNFVRVFSELDKIYSTSNLSFDIIENLLVDIQLDITIDGQLSRELRLTNKILKNDNFAKYAYIAKKARKSSRLNDVVSLNERYDDLIDLISTFPFLRELSFTLRKMENAFIIDKNNQKLPVESIYDVLLQYDNIDKREKDFDVDLDTYESIIKVNGLFYFLERVEIITQDDSPYLLLTYWQLGMYNNALKLCISSSSNIKLDSYQDTVLISSDTAYEEYAYNIISTNENSDDDSDFRIKNFYSINYKYVKNLALSISDVLKESSRKCICNLYGKKHNFVENIDGVTLSKDGKQINYSWDEIVSVLMVEEGATNILSYLLKTDNTICSRLLSNLQFRFGVSQFSKVDIEKNIEEAIEEFDKKISQKNHINESNRNAYDRELADYHAEIQSGKIIYAISKAVNGNNIEEFKLDFPVSIRSKILLLEEIKNSDLTFEDKLESIKKIIFNTIKTLYCFYYGFFSYANIKKEFDNESFFKSLTAKEVNNYQKLANESFRKNIREKQKELSSIPFDDPCTIILKFKEFCIECESNINNGQTQLLKDLLGKNKIIDTKMLDFLLSSLTYDTNEETLEELVFDIKKVFTYLRTGQSRNSNVSLGVIFPYVATCEYTDVSRDGNIVYHFSIITNNGHEKMLRVLSEFSYKLNEKYYLLPNKLCSDDRLNLWIEPIIISYENFDLDEEEQDELNI